MITAVLSSIPMIAPAHVIIYRDENVSDFIQLVFSYSQMITSVYFITQPDDNVCVINQPEAR
jgi:hypothetical protein